MPGAESRLNTKPQTLNRGKILLQILQQRVLDLPQPYAGGRIGDRQNQLAVFARRRGADDFGKSRVCDVPPRRRLHLRKRFRPPQVVAPAARHQIPQNVVDSFHRRVRKCTKFRARGEQKNENILCRFRPFRSEDSGFRRNGISFSVIIFKWKILWRRFCRG